MSDREQDYERLKARLSIDLLRVSQEVSESPAVLQECVELAIAVECEELAARLALDVITAEAAARLREPEEGRKARSETQIASELAMLEDVQAARAAYDQSKLDSKRFNSLVASMRDKVRLVGKAADMTVAGFVAPSSYTGQRTRGKEQS